MVAMNRSQEGPELFRTVTKFVELAFRTPDAVFCVVCLEGCVNS